MKGKMKSTKGITLIALVITIVVLLILAGVSLNLVIGQNGLITKSKEAVKEYNKAAKLERLQLILTEYQITEDKDALESNIAKENFEKDENGNIVIGDSKYGFDEDYNLVEIPDIKWTIENNTITWFEILNDIDVSTLIVPNKIKGVSITKLGISYDTMFEPNTENYNANKANIKKVILQEGIQEIAEGTFQDTTSIETVILPETITAIGEGAFRRSNIKKITLPNSLEEINSQVFQDATKLEKVVLGDNVSYIGYGAFQRTNLNSINFPNKLVTIDGCAFEDTKLSEIKLGNQVTTIGEFAFKDISTLTKVYIGSGITSIGTSAFGGDKNISKFVINTSESSITFGATWKDPSVTVEYNQ